MDPMVLRMQQNLVRLGYVTRANPTGAMDRSTRDALRLFQRLHDVESYGIPDAYAIKLIEQAVSDDECVVYGTIESESPSEAGLRPLERPVARVTVSDRTLRALRTVGEGTVALGDSFAFRYSGPSVASDGQGNVKPGGRAWVADLLFDIEPVKLPISWSFETIDVVPLPQGSPLSLVDVRLGLQASRVQEVSLRLVGFVAYSDVTEFDELHNLYAASWPQGPPLIDLAVEQASDEVLFVARELAVPVQHVSLLVSAHRLSRRAVELGFGGLQPEALYGLGRRVGTLELSVVASMRVTAITDAISWAVRDTVIPAPSRPIDQVAEGIAEFAMSAVAGDNSYVDMRLLSFLDVDQRVRLIEANRTVDGSATAIWAHLREHGVLDDDLIARVQLHLQLGVLTRGDASLVERIIERGNVRSPRDLALQGWSSDELEKVIREIPPDASGSGLRPEEAGAVRAAAERIAETIAVAFPTETTARLVRDIDAKWFGSVRPGVVADVLEESSDPHRFGSHRLDLRRTRLDVFADRHSDEIDALGDRAVLDQLKRVQRLYRMSVDPVSLRGLLESRHTSANSIAQIPARVFIARHREAVGGESTAARIHQRAVTHRASILHVAVSTRRAATSVNARTIGSGITFDRGLG